MSERTVRFCDICGKDQAQVNGWFAYWTADHTFHVAHASDVPMWEGLLHACGQGCVHKALDTFLAAQKVQPVTPIQTIQSKPEYQNSQGKERAI